MEACNWNFLFDVHCVSHEDALAIILQYSEEEVIFLFELAVPLLHETHDRFFYALFTPTILANNWFCNSVVLNGNALHSTNCLPSVNLFQLRPFCWIKANYP